MNFLVCNPYILNPVRQKEKNGKQYNEIPTYIALTAGKFWRIIHFWSRIGFMQNKSPATDTSAYVKPKSDNKQYITVKCVI